MSIVEWAFCCLKMIMKIALIHQSIDIPPLIDDTTIDDELPMGINIK